MTRPELPDLSEYALFNETGEPLHDEVGNVIYQSMPDYVDYDNKLATLQSNSTREATYVNLVGDHYTYVKFKWAYLCLEIDAMNDEVEQYNTEVAGTVYTDADGKKKTYTEKEYVEFPDAVEPMDVDAVAKALAIQNALDLVDVTVGKMRELYISKGALIIQEYQLAQTSVKDWRAAGSPEDDVPAALRSWAISGGMSDEGAAAEIENTSFGWEYILIVSRELRLKAKAEIRLKGQFEDPMNIANNYIWQIEELAPPGMS